MKSKLAAAIAVPFVLASTALAEVPAAYTTKIAEVVDDAESIGTATILLLIGLVGVISLGVIAMSWTKKSRGAAK